MKSVLYRDATIDHDRVLVSRVVSAFVTGSDDEGFKNKCVDRIMSTVQTEKWQRIYKSGHFVHIAELYCGEKYTDIKFMLMCQVLEIIYFFKHGNKSDHFNDKLYELFFGLYQRQINSNIADVLRALRNHVAHTGSVIIIDGAISDKQTELMKNFQKDHEGMYLSTLAVNFNYLMEDILLRCLGLGDDELFRNGNPPQFFEIFKELIKS